jgi:hypothetical protein
MLMALREIPHSDKCYRDVIAINEKFFYAHHGLGRLLVDSNWQNEARHYLLIGLC